MGLVEQLLLAVKTIISGNIWIGTIFWIAVGMFFVMIISKTWDISQKIENKLCKAALIFVCVGFLFEMLIVISLSLGMK